MDGTFQKGNWLLVHLAAQKLVKHRKNEKRKRKCKLDLVFAGNVTWINLIGFKAANSEN